MPIPGRISIIGNSLAKHTEARLRKQANEFKMEAVGGARLIGKNANSIRSQIRKANEFSMSIMIEPISVHMLETDEKDEEAIKNLEIKVMREFKSLNKEMKEDGKIAVIIRCQLQEDNEDGNKNYKLDGLYFQIGKLESFVVSPEQVPRIYTRKDRIHHTENGIKDLVNKIEDWMKICRKTAGMKGIVTRLGYLIEMDQMRPTKS